MFDDKISDYIEGVAAKYLSSVDAEKNVSNQHEIGGLVKAKFGKFLGIGKEDYHFRVRQIYIQDEIEDPVICDSHVTWYDTRRDNPERAPEYRLYYYDSPFTEKMSKGDFFLIVKLKNELAPIGGHASFDEESIPFRDGSFLMISTPAGNPIEHQLKAMFGLHDLGSSFKPGHLDVIDLLLPLRSMLENLGIEIGSGLKDEHYWLGKLIEKFGGKTFPSTSKFSTYARESVADFISHSATSDSTLMTWMEREEGLFRIYERHLVSERLATGFGLQGEDVDEFISFSLSVQNRRKSRVGHAFEGHLDFLFRQFGLKFEQGRGKGKVTEQNSKPDFIFPSFSSYRDMDFPESKLLMLGAKTTCKDRWRQVLSEAKRIKSKHLVTLEPAISEGQTEEMRSHHLQLVVPSSIHTTYSENQRKQLMDLNSFIAYVKSIQDY